MRIRHERDRDRDRDREGGREGRRDISAVLFIPEIIEKAAIGHELSDDKHGLLARADSKQLDKIRMLDLYNTKSYRHDEHESERHRDQHACQDEMLLRSYPLHHIGFFKKIICLHVFFLESLDCNLHNDTSNMPSLHQRGRQVVVTKEDTTRR